MTVSAPWFVAIGASGSEGLSDMQEVLRGLRIPVNAIIMAAVHRPSGKVSHLRSVLANACDLPVVVAEEAETLVPGTCYIGQPDQHLTLVDTVLAHLIPGSHDMLRNRNIDVLLKSIAAHAGRKTIGIILSGSLDDGSRGLAAIHEARGFTMVLEPGNKPRGMQQNAIDYDGRISFIGNAAEIAAMVMRLTTAGRNVSETD